ncbi:MAG TPA: glutamate carboxypeptidase [Phenylobacterium sp.]|jgi:glutamate carboxypeptidase|uniref:glutamate carboxypeptidase n=1 Tax=Phenylobacterium sp. TaxID=1871053 RepID=UPI002B79122E|nr:glutamate carboxypeptidase [Phenylobacterium sp.]HXA40164.1 glutamate carboxypeptidase [Phenylobacterium sp.]
MTFKLIALAGAAVLLALPVHAAPAPARDAKVWAAAEAARPAQLKLLEQVVNIDSGTGDVEGGRKVAGILGARLKAMGFAVESVKAEADGLPDNTVATLSGTGKGRVLLIGHIDTVFEPGTVAQRPFRMDAEKAYGPGVSDEKGGVVEGVYALQILHDLGFKDFKQVVFLIETSEERGSPGAQGLINRLVADADVELNLEPGDTPDVLTVWRKGATAIHIDVHGRAAHAGIAPQEGRNAATELIHQIAADEIFPKTGDGITFNLTTLKAGTRENIIPEDASATYSLRIREKSDLPKVEAVLQKNARTTVVPDTTVKVWRQERFFPPLASNPGTDALADRAEAIYAGLGKTITRGGNGGASESALAYEGGIPALDGLGPAAGGFHADTEYLLLGSLTPRLYLLTKLIQELGHQPPPRLK